MINEKRKMTDHNPSSTDTPQHVVNHLQQLSEEAIEDGQKQQMQQQSPSSDWSSGVDVVELGVAILDGLGDLLSGVDISF